MVGDFKVVERLLFLELFVLRHAMGLRKSKAKAANEPITRSNESFLYGLMISASKWKNVVASFVTLDDKTYQENTAIRQTQPMHLLLTAYKFNDEDTDDTTTDVMTAMDQVDQCYAPAKDISSAKETLALVTGMINGKGFLRAFLSNVKGLTSKQLLSRCEGILKASKKRTKLFTRSFNKQTYNQKDHKSIAAKRLDKVKSFLAKKFKYSAVRRRKLQLDLVKQFKCCLLAKNCFSYLEYAFPRCRFACRVKSGDKGSILGPGALACNNVMR